MLLSRRNIQEDWNEYLKNGMTPEQAQKERSPIALHIFSIHFRLSIMMLELFEYTDHKYFSVEINGKNQTYIKLFYNDKI